MELGESIVETAIRETYEEIGIKISEIELFGVYSGKELYYIYPNGDEVQNVSIAFVGHIDSPPILDPIEHSDFKFFDLSSLPENVSPPIKPIINDFIKKYKYKFGADEHGNGQ